MKHPLSSQEQQKLQMKTEREAKVLHRLSQVPELYEALTILKDQYTVAWSSSRPAESEQREAAYQRLCAMSDFETLVRNYATTK